MTRWSGGEEEEQQEEVKEVHLDVLTDCGADFVVDHFPLVALALVTGTTWP